MTLGAALLVVLILLVVLVVLVALPLCCEGAIQRRLLGGENAEGKN